MAGKRCCYPSMVTLASFWRMLMAYFAGSGSLNTRLANQSFISLQAAWKSQRLHRISCGLAKWGKACEKSSQLPLASLAHNHHISLSSHLPRRPRWTKRLQRCLRGSSSPVLTCWRSYSTRCWASDWASSSCVCWASAWSREAILSS